MFTPWNLAGQLLFRAIGADACLYGFKQKLAKPFLIGVTHSVYPWFVGSTWLVYLVGCLLTAALFLFRD